MCGRYSLDKNIKTLIARYKASRMIGDHQANDEIFPTNLAPVVINRGDNIIGMMKWGFMPSFAKRPLINARGETVDLKASFRNSFYSRRCIIPVSSFYEWEKVDGKKVRRRISLEGQEIFSLAGLYDKFRDKDGKEYSAFTIITVEANDSMKNIHDRMPVIIDENMESKWLDRENRDIGELKALIKPYQAKILIV